MKTFLLTLTVLALSFAAGAATEGFDATSDGSLVDFTPKKKVKTKNFNIRVFPLSAIFYSAPHLSAEAAVSRRFTLGLEGFYMPDFRSNSVLGDDYGLMNYREAYFGPMAQYYFDRAFKGFFIEVGADFVMAEVNYFNKYYSGNIMLAHAEAGYRLATKSGINVGFAAGAGQYIGDPLEYGYYPGEKYNSPYVPRTFFRARLDIGYSF